MIGMSLYPYWSRDAKPEYTAADAVITDCIKNIKAVSAKYNCDVMVVETGMECADDKGTWQVLPYWQKGNANWPVS
mgnify:CR=1 FL=1